MNLHDRWRQAANDVTFENALSTLESMGLIDQLDDLVDPQPNRPTRRLSMALLLTALLLTHRTISGFTLTDTYQFLTERLSPAAQARHGLRDDPAGVDTLTYRQVVHLYRRFERCTDPAIATDDADRFRRLRFWAGLHVAMSRLRVDLRARSVADGTTVPGLTGTGRLRDPDAVWRHRRPVMRGPVGYPWARGTVPARCSALRPEGALRSGSEQASTTKHTQHSDDVTVDRGHTSSRAWDTSSWRAAYDEQAARERMFGRLKGDG
jgi:hypothetical protein